MPRKPTLTLAIATALGVAAPVAAVAADAPARAPEPGGRSPLRAESFRLDAGSLSGGPQGSLQTRRMDTSPYTMLAVTSPGEALPAIDVRTRAAGADGGGAWSRWQPLEAFVEHTTGAADEGAGGAKQVRLAASELLWVGPSDGVQVRLDRAGGPGTRLRLVHPGVLPSDKPSAPSAPAPRPRDRDRPDSPDPTNAPQPAIHTREEWGANESWRDGRPTYSGTIKQAHIHHNTGSNAYDRDDVPMIIRADYWYHTQVLGWSDLGYNFLVDKFGRIWEGRNGSINRPVQGAHTLGFNHRSFGIAVIGNYETTTPPKDVVRALVRLTAWKLDEYDRRPAGKTMMTSRGSDEYPYGAKVRLPVIDGHRDTNLTDCPGDRLYAKLPEIRDRARKRADGVFSPGAPKAGDRAPAPPGS